MLLEIVIIVQTEVLGERRFQTRITSADCQRVAVVHDVKQVADRRLTVVGTIVEAQLTLLRPSPTEIERRSKVRHGTGGISMHTLIVLNIV